MPIDVSAAGRTVISKAAVILMTYLNGDVHTSIGVVTPRACSGFLRDIG